MTEVSYLGYVHGTMVALSRMRPLDTGTMVQVGSALGGRAIPLQSAYCGAKHAINGFTESVRTELMHEHSNIHITVAQMPAVNTPQFSWCSRATAPPAASAADLPARGRRPRRIVRRRSPAAQAILGRSQHGRDRPRSTCRSGTAGPLPGQDRLRLATDRRAGQPRPSQQSVATPRWRPGRGPRRARCLRRPFVERLPTAVVFSPRPPDSVRRCSGGLATAAAVARRYRR